jgi:beta-ureidopropionase
LKIGYAQFEPQIDNKELNLKRVKKLISIASKKGAELLVIPEYFNTGYPFFDSSEVNRLSEHLDGHSVRLLESEARENSIFLVGSICEKRETRYYNTAVLIAPSGVVGQYSKAHLWDAEKIWISPGKSNFKVFDIGKAKLGLMICFDWRFPEVPRILALKGADIICQPANLLLPFCQTAMLGAAVQNGLFIVTANRVGTCRGIEYTGNSQIVDPLMRILAKSDSKNEAIEVVDIDIQKARNKQINQYNNLFKDRRVELYEEILNQSKIELVPRPQS